MQMTKHHARKHTGTQLDAKSRKAWTQRTPGQRGARGDEDGALGPGVGKGRPQGKEGRNAKTQTHPAAPRGPAPGPGRGKNGKELEHLMQGYEGLREGQHPTRRRGTRLCGKAARADAYEAASSRTKAMKTVRQATEVQTILQEHGDGHAP